MGDRMKKFKELWKNYLMQSFFATLSLFVVLLILNIKYQVVIASIGATAFIVFITPKSSVANAKNVIGGHLIGLLCGSLCSLIPQVTLFHSILVYSLAVGLSIFLMVVVGVRHPPAAGTALGVALTGFSWNVTLAVIVSAVILSIFHHVLKPFLKDLK